jgi:hypothetical protein
MQSAVCISWDPSSEVPYIISCLLMFHSSQALVYELTGQKNAKKMQKRRETLLATFFFEGLFYCTESCAGCARPFWRGHRNGEHHAQDWPGHTQVPGNLTVPDVYIMDPEPEP